mmetsp:Transcript_66005/g.193121  ORF Transcript_66005/g.193121 Transcript_66005/m.193121 type:complete len:231 (+) Transcript_66005:2748-3440(+)
MVFWSSSYSISQPTSAERQAVADDTLTKITNPQASSPASSMPMTIQQSRERPRNWPLRSRISSCLSAVMASLATGCFETCSSLATFSFDPVVLLSSLSVRPRKTALRYTSHTPQLLRRLSVPHSPSPSQSSPTPTALQAGRSACSGQSNGARPNSTWPSWQCGAFAAMARSTSELSLAAAEALTVADALPVKAPAVPCRSLAMFLCTRWVLASSHWMPGCSEKGSHGRPP